MDTVTVDFSLDQATETADGENVVFSGRFFQAGDYPDKGFSLTPNEMYAAIGRFFKPVPMDLEHKPLEFAGVDLSGLFGQVRRLWAEPDDTDGWMFAEVTKPKDLHRVMPERRISATFRKDTKEVIGAAWTATPRVQGAEMVAAFSSLPHVTERMAAFADSKHNTPQGQLAIQQIHDMAAGAGATCVKGNAVKMASAHEATAIQKIHDMATDHGAKCASGDAPSWARSPFSHTQPSDKRPAPSAKGAKMGFIDTIKALFADAGVPADKIEAHLQGVELPSGDASTFSVAEKADLQKQVAELKRAKVEAEAVTFADTAVRARRIMPGEKADLIAQFCEAAEDDDKSPRVVKFSSGGQEQSGSRVEALMARVAARPQHSLTMELVDPSARVTPGHLNALFAHEETAPKSDETPGTPEENAKLLAMTPLGQEAMRN